MFQPQHMVNKLRVGELKNNTVDTAPIRTEKKKMAENLRLSFATTRDSCNWESQVHILCAMQVSLWKA